MRTKLLAVTLLLSIAVLVSADYRFVYSCVYLVSRQNATVMDRWEPTSAVSPVTWATGWTELNPPSTVRSYAARWGNSPGSWVSTTHLQVNGNETGDIYLAFDSKYNSGQGRFVMAVLDLSALSIWFGYSTNAWGDQWSFRSIPAMTASGNITWDYPSIGVDGTEVDCGGGVRGGRIVIGAPRIVSSGGQPASADFRTVISTDCGASFSASAALVPGTDEIFGFGSGESHQARVVGTDTKFHAFTQRGNVTRDLNRYEWDWNAMTWTGPNLLHTFDTAYVDSTPATYSDGCPDPNRPCSCAGQGCGPIFFTRGIDARGHTNGLWTVVVPTKRSYGIRSYNNIYICTSSRGCGLINAVANNQFLAGTSVSADGGYWVAYHTFSSNDVYGQGVLPLLTQAIYFFPPPAPAQDPMYSTTFFNVDPKKWRFTYSRCGSQGCFAAGDYVGIASNPSRFASTPFIGQPHSSRPGRNDLYQKYQYVQDVGAGVAGGSSTQPRPNFVPYPVGADLTSRAGGSGQVAAPTTEVYAAASGRGSTK